MTAVSRDRQQGPLLFPCFPGRALRLDSALVQAGCSRWQAERLGLGVRSHIHFWDQAGSLWIHMNENHFQSPRWSSFLGFAAEAALP